MPCRENTTILHWSSVSISKMARYPFDLPRFSPKGTTLALYIFRSPKPGKWSMPGVSLKPFNAKNRSHASSDSCGAENRFNRLKSPSSSSCRHISMRQGHPIHWPSRHIYFDNKRGCNLSPHPALSRSTELRRALRFSFRSR